MLSYRWTVGSCLFLASFAAVMGPWAYVQHLTSGPRLPFTAGYLGSLALSLYFAVGVSPLLIAQAADRSLQISAAQYLSYLDISHHSTRLLGLVHGQLLPHGVKRTSPGDHFWRQARGCVDDRLTRGAHSRRL